MLVLVQAGLGGLTVETSLAEELVAAHLGLAMILIGLCSGSPSGPGRSSPRAEPSAEAVARPTPPRGLKSLSVAAAVLLLCAIVAGGYVAGTEEEGVSGSGVNIAGAHMACGEQFPGCLNQGVAPFGESRLSDIHLTHRMFVYGATLAILALLGVALYRGSRSRLLLLAGLLLADPGRARRPERAARGARDPHHRPPDHRHTVVEHRAADRLHARLGPGARGGPLRQGRARRGVDRGGGSLRMEAKTGTIHRGADRTARAAQRRRRDAGSQERAPLAHGAGDRCATTSP